MIARSAQIRLLLFCAFAVGLRAQPAVSESALLLSRIKRVMQEHLAGAPNYTCLLSVERFQQKQNAPRETLIDVLRLEVAFVGGKELFAWPGSSRFEDQEIREVVATGAFGTGDFVLHARGVFLGDGTQFNDLGDEVIDGRATHKFSYFKPLFRSGYQISNQARGREEVAYRGFFWVDRTSLDLIRLTVEAIDIPVSLRVRAATNVLDYGKVPLSGREALLPQRGELRMTDDQGLTSINRMRLSRCKLFQGESSISFADIDEKGPDAAASKRRIFLPPNLEVDLGLESEITHGQSAVGDRIEARLRHDIKQGKEILFPKGSLARGRIVELTRHENPDCFTVAFRMEEIEAPDRSAALHLRLLRTEPNTAPPSPKGPGIAYLEYPLPTRGGFVWFKPQLRLSRGFATIWETQSIAP